MKGYIFFVALYFLAFPVTAQKVAATADKQKILIGQQFHLRLQANFHKGESLDFFEIDTIPRFEILDKSGIDTSTFSGGLALTQTFTMTSWDSGKIQIPPMAMGKYQTKPLAVTVAYSPSPFDTTQPYHDIHDILPVKRPGETTWYWYLVGLLVVILLFLLFFPKAKARPGGEFVSDEGAYRRALKKLDALQKRTDEDSKTFYTELVQIFRDYLHKRKNIYSFSQTTEDLSIQMGQLAIETGQYRELVQTLRLSDLVKYAKYQPSEEDNRKALNDIREGIVLVEQVQANKPIPQTSKT